MVDTFMSGWGKAEGKQNILIFECENKAEAYTVARYASTRNDQRDIHVYREDQQLPEFNPKKFYVQHKTKSEYPLWYGIV